MNTPRVSQTLESSHGPLRAAIGVRSFPSERAHRRRYTHFVGENPVIAHNDDDTNAYQHPTGFNPLRRIPDRRGICPVLDGHPYRFRHLDAEAFSVVSGPARGWDLDYPNVVKGALIGIEFRIFPVGHQ